MNKEIKEKAKKLKEERKYNEILNECGKLAYYKYVPSKYRKEQLKKLSKEGKYEEIYRKYRKSDYNKAVKKAMYNEIKETKGITKAIIWKIKRGLKIFGITSTLSFSALTAGIASVTELEIKENAEKYESEIEEYNEKIKAYAKEINAMKLNDVQIFMKVIYDMWKNIQGYKDPEKDIVGFFELDLMTEDGYGVCRNMASDVARKLNEINPEYNARTFTVSIDEDGIYRMANIERKILDVDENTQKNNRPKSIQINSIKKEAEELMYFISGNHEVTLVDVKDDNLIIVLDPTNPGIGIYKDGKITMMNSGKEGGKQFHTREYFEAISTRGGIEGIKDITMDYIRSFEEPKLTAKEIEEKYGLEAQNRCLEEIKNMQETRDFKKSIKVNPEILEKRNTENQRKSSSLENFPTI